MMERKYASVGQLLVDGADRIRCPVCGEADVEMTVSVSAEVRVVPYAREGGEVDFRAAEGRDPLDGAWDPWSYHAKCESCGAEWSRDPLGHELDMKLYEGGRFGVWLEAPEGRAVAKTWRLDDWVVAALGNHLGREVPLRQRDAVAAAVLRGANPAQAVEPVDAMVEGALAYVYGGKLHTQELVAAARSKDGKTFFLLTCLGDGDTGDHRLVEMQAEAVRRSVREVALSLKSLETI